ncbi:MAG: 4Fe-4S dicluster domain-containing protein [Planctomycetes bacterium]|nr:4Fe-4S dicluster domain-containing protein [Planctomycetota bacterium]
MPDSHTTVRGLKRWEVPFGRDMSAREVNELLALPLFSRMDPGRFPPHLPLRGILQNECRIRRCLDREIILRQGDYGTSVFLILSGAARIFVGLPEASLGRREARRTGFFGALARLWRRPGLPEVREATRPATDNVVFDTYWGGEHSTVFLQDIPGAIDAAGGRLVPGQLFGEQSALGRIPRTATLTAEGPTALLEIRWQGLRDLRKFEPGFRELIDRQFRTYAEMQYLRAMPYLSGLNDGQLRQISDQTEFESYGEFDWYGTYQEIAGLDAAARLASEPVIAEEGSHPAGLVLIRSGFARVTRRHGHGHRTLAYLGKGQAYGLEELAHNWRRPEAVAPLATTLRAVGYVDTIVIPTRIVEQFVLPAIPRDRVDRWTGVLAAAPGPEGATAERASGATAAALAVPGARRAGEGREDLLEFLVEERFINGREAMVIDLDRCTRCDDCVRACAATHDNNPRFVRQGLTCGNTMIVNACMHCADPVCMIGCPTGAIHRDREGGQVVINDLTCIGCRTCAESCPYGNIRMVDIRSPGGKAVVAEATHAPIQKATKCDLCVESPGGPACVRACPHDALRRLDLTRPEVVERELGR